MTQGYKPVSLKNETYDRLTEICRKSGHAKTEILSQYINELFILTAKIDNFNLEYNTDLLNDVLHVIARDRKYRASESQASTAKAESKVSPITVKVEPKKQEGEKHG